jgi:ribose transport system substrate-binding protein
MRLLIRGITVSVIAFALLAGCQASATPSSNAPSSPTSAATIPASASPSTSTPNEQGFVIGHILDASDPNEVAVDNGLKTQATAYGWQLKTVDVPASASGANDAMVTLVNLHVNAIIVEVYPESALSAGLNAATAAHIPVYLSLGTGQPTGDVIGISGQAAGDISAQYMADQMTGGTGSVLAITFHSGSPCVVNEAGFDSVMTKYPGIKVEKLEVDINNILSWGQTTGSAWLLQHPAGSGNLAIWGCFDRPVLGAEIAIKAAGRTDVKTYGIFGEAGALANVRDGLQTVTWWFDTNAAGVAIVQAIKRYFDNPSAWTASFVPQVPTRLDASNIAAFLTAHPKLLTP